MIISWFLSLEGLPAFYPKGENYFFGTWSVLLNRNNKFTLLSLHCLFLLLSMGWCGASVCNEWKPGRVSIVLGRDGRRPAPSFNIQPRVKGGDDVHELG